MMPQQTAYETNILFPSCNEFGYGQVMDFEAQGSPVAGIFVSNCNQPLFPSLRQDCGLFANTVRVVTERVMKWREFTDASIDQFSVALAAKSKHIGFNRNQQLFGWIRKLTEYCLTADHHKLMSAGYRCRGTNNVFKLRALHVEAGL